MLKGNELNIKEGGERERETGDVLSASRLDRWEGRRRRGEVMNERRASVWFLASLVVLKEELGQRLVTLRPSLSFTLIYFHVSLSASPPSIVLSLSVS